MSRKAASRHSPARLDRPPPPPSRRLIVNADDLGMGPGVNRGIARAHRNGIVTSASLMVRRPAAEQAAALARSLPTLAVGLHLDLGEWGWTGSGWEARYTVVPTESPEAVGQELDRQLARFRRLLGRPPSHIDSHQHVHMQGPALDVVLARAAALGVPVRGRSGIRWCGDFYGRTGRGEPYPEGIMIEALETIVARLPPGVTELVCHPGLDCDDPDYGAEREAELAALCHPRIRRLIRKRSIELLSYRQVQPAG